MVRVLVAEDSAVTREYLVYLLEQADGLTVAGTARDGFDAVEHARRLRPDVILMDVHMPRLNGFEATRRIMEEIPTPIVMISASLDRNEVGMTFEALKAGALTVIEKPGGPGHPDEGATTRELVNTLRLMAGVKVIRRWPRPGTPPVTSRPRPLPERQIRVVAMGASTGGPPAVAGILEKLPQSLAVPILLVQHIAPGFIDGLAEWLAGQTRLAVKLAEAGEPLRPATVYLAPDHVQMGVAPGERIFLTKEPAADGFCPSVSYLFQRVAHVYGRSGVGVLLTGMGRDGAVGLQQLRDAGAVTIAQDEETSVIFGMPGEAIRLGAAEYVLSPEQIADMIRALVIR